MARARNIKPGFFKNETLADFSCETRLLFVGLWTLADREGRLEDRPKRIRAEIFPFDGFDVNSMLNELSVKEFLIRYEVDGTGYIQITNFVKHQDPHYREKASEIPPVPGMSNEIVATGVTKTQRARILERDDHKCQQCGSTDHPCIDHIIPVLKGGDSSDGNLQILCLPCVTKKGNKVDSTSSRTQSKEVVTSPLIPDSLIPDSLIPDSLIPDSVSDEDKSSSSSSQAESCDSPPPKDSIPYKKIVALYHEILPMCPRLGVLTNTRKSYIAARWKSGAIPDLDTWRDYFTFVGKSKFLTGGCDPAPGKKRFCADLEWMTRESNFVKIYEKKYHGEA